MLGESLVTDNEFDLITKNLIDNIDKIKDSTHIHKHLIDINMLKSYTGFNLKYPNIVKVCAKEMIDENNTKSNDMNDLF